MSNRRSRIPLRQSKKSFTKHAMHVHRDNIPVQKLGAFRGGERK